MYPISRDKMYNQCFILLFRFILFDLVSLSNSNSLVSCMFRLKSTSHVSRLIKVNIIV